MLLAGTCFDTRLLDRPARLGSRPRSTPSMLFLVVLLLVAAAAAGCGETETAGPSRTEPSPEPATTEVSVYFPQGELDESCAEVYPVSREVDADDPLTGALEALLAGPTEAELAEGYGGWFTSATAGMLLEAEVSDGIASIDLADLREVIPGASSSCGSELLLAQLDRTILAVVDVDHAEYAIEGDVEAFYTWLQYDVPAREPAAALTVDRIVAEIERELETDAVAPREVTLSCDADGTVHGGDVFVCAASSDPPEPVDWGSFVVAVLGEDLVALSTATDNPGSTAQLLELYAAAPSGLRCEDLRAGEAPFPFDVSTTDEVGASFWSIVYWNLEGQPARMDADLDGVPCETLYPDDAVAAVLRTIAP
jgi:hypothetical protein